LLLELIALIGAAELDNLIIGLTIGANGAPFWLILAADLILTAIVLCVGNYFGGYFEKYKDRISRISGAIFMLIGIKMCLLL
jgi:putative Mn2+ efflux pump MntP